VSGLNDLLPTTAVAIPGCISTPTRTAAERLANAVR
jgi:hypothetical protein